MRLHVDIETYSPAPIADTGNYKYAMDPGFEILLVAYAFGSDPVRVVDLASGENLPSKLLNALVDPTITKVAHNAVFERVCFTMWLRRQGLIGKAAWLDPAEWDCTMVRCYMAGLPGSLKEAGAVLGFEQQKMTEGKALIKKFCTPSKTGGLLGSERVMPDDDPESWATFKAYCIRDVEVEREIDKALSWVRETEAERAIYEADQRINDRGVLVDLTMVRNASKIDAMTRASLAKEAAVITGLSNPNSIPQLRSWLEGRLGASVETLRKTDVMDIAAQTTDPDVKRILSIRQQLGKTSNAKYPAMLDATGADGRARGLLQFYGTRTGRWAGRLVQLQNLPQNHLPLDELAFARKLVCEGDYTGIQLCYGNVNDTLSQLIRTAFVAPEGKTLAVCDFSAIEARVLAWLAGEQWVLDTFRSGGDIYCATASQMFHVPVEKHGQNAELRQKGKIAVLALGYGGGQKALDAMGGQRLGMSEDEEQQTVRMWRDANPGIVRFWHDIEDAALKVVGGYQQTARVSIKLPISTEEYEARLSEARKVDPDCDSVRNYSVNGICLEFSMLNGWLLCKLPSGRQIAWPQAKPTVNRFDSTSIEYRGIDQTTNKWVRLETYGGKLAENITQAVARDCLADVITRIDRDCPGIDIVFHVHDEIVAEVDEAGADQALKAIQEVFAIGPAWAAGLPLKGAGYITPYYLKD